MHQALGVHNHLLFRFRRWGKEQQKMANESTLGHKYTDWTFPQLTFGQKSNCTTSFARFVKTVLIYVHCLPSAAPSVKNTR